MARRRLKHKQVIETIEQNDLEVAWEKITRFWDEKVRPNENRILGVLFVAMVFVAAFYYVRNQRMSRRMDANFYLAEAWADFNSGDTEGALSELNYVLPGGEYTDSKIAVAARMTQASIAYASGDYETAVSILTDLIPEVPETIRADLMYQLAAAEESLGDYEAAEKTLDEIVEFFDEEPDTTNPDRSPSVWDRYYYRKGRLLKKMGKEQEAAEYLLKVSERSRWIADARAELAWLTAKPVGSLQAGSGTPEAQ